MHQKFDNPEDEKEYLYKQMYAQKRDEYFEKIKDAHPLLYWTKKYHLNTRGEELDFRGMWYLLELYKHWHEWPLISVIKSVQVGLSELFIADIHRLAAMGLTVMDVLPKYEIRNRFVNNRVTRLHRKSGMYAQLIRYAAKQGGAHNVSLTHFGKGGIAWVGSNVEDEFIEIPVDAAFVDEYDRCNQRNLLLLPDRLTASPYKFQREISNPTIEGFGIDARFQQGTRTEWHLKCEHCNTWFIPDFFKHVVREVGSHLYQVRDKNFNPDDSHSTSLICEKCNKRVDRLAKGQYVDEFPTREWKSLRISQITNKHTSLTKNAVIWLEIGANKTKQMIFFNSILGRAFSAEGAKVLDWMLDRLRRNYRFPCVPSALQEGIRTMGVDVGASLHYVIRERTKESGVSVRKLLTLGEAKDFKELRTLIRQWNPKRVVIDANPEIHEVAALKADFACVYSSRFQTDLIELTVNKEDRHIRVDRTAALDRVKQEIDEERVILPMEGSSLHNEQYYIHMTASTRLLEENESKKDTKERFVWREGSKPDHFFLAECYESQANQLLPEHSAFDFFTGESNDIETQIAKGRDLKGMLSEGNTKALTNMTPEIFHTTISKTYEGPKITKRDMSSVDREILDVAETLLANFGKIEVAKLSQGSGLTPIKAEQFLTQNGFVQRGGGYVRNEQEESL